jgi:hypothetical protein
MIASPYVKQIIAIATMLFSARALLGAVPSRPTMSQWNGIISSPLG